MSSGSWGEKGMSLGKENNHVWIFGERVVFLWRYCHDGGGRDTGGAVHHDFYLYWQTSKKETGTGVRKTPAVVRGMMADARHSRCGRPP